MGCGTLSSHAVQSWPDHTNEGDNGGGGSKEKSPIVKTQPKNSPGTDKNSSKNNQHTHADSENRSPDEVSQSRARHGNVVSDTNSDGQVKHKGCASSKDCSSSDVVLGIHTSSEAGHLPTNSSRIKEGDVGVSASTHKTRGGDSPLVEVETGETHSHKNRDYHPQAEQFSNGLDNFVNNLVEEVTKAALVECCGEDSLGAKPESSPRPKEKRAKEAQKRTKKKESKSSVTSTSGQTLEDYPTAQENSFIPHFVYKCVSHIEAEGMKTEGLYRIPGNKAQGELFLTQYSADPNVDISTLEIPVNAIATLLKSFFSDLSEALIPSALCDELLEAAEMTDKSSRLLMLRGVIKKLPNQNFEVLKFIISHLYKVSEQQEFNSMNSGNLAKCWWPTLIRLQFKTYERLVQYSQVPEDIVQTLIEQCPFFFYGGNEV